MVYRIAAASAVAGLLACSSLAMADDTHLSLDPTVLTADAASERAPLMMALDKVGAAKPLDDLGLNIYGWIEAGYSYNHRHHGNEDPILPGPFNHEVGNHFMLNQVTLRFEREVASDKFDVGGLVEVSYGTDANLTHSSGLGFNGNDPTTDDSPEAPDDYYRANYGFDLLQAYLTVNLPVGNGLKLTIGKFITLLGYETVDPRPNLFYSHSWLFSAMPYSGTGVLATYSLNDKLSVTAGFTRGWDMTLEDNNGCAIDALGNITYNPNDQISLLFNWNVGPENPGDSSHYGIELNPIMTWKVTDALSLAVEGYYLYDGGLNSEENDSRHAYGDIWGATFYASYKINDYLTLNGRVEKYHGYSDDVGALGDVSDLLNFTQGFVENGGVPTINIYSFTLGCTITPMPGDSVLKNLSIRPEIRYDLSEDHVFIEHGAAFKDQLTFAADVIFKF